YQNLEQTQRTFFSTQDQERAPFASDRFGQDDQETLGLGASWTHRLSNSTFYQVQFDWSKFERYRYDAAFSQDINDVIFYGDIDHAANATAARYKLWSEEDSTYRRNYSDGSLPALEDVYSVLTAPGGSDQAYLRNDNAQFRLSANATTQVGLHQIEFGGEFEQRTQRLYYALSGIGGISSAARYFDDGTCEAGAGQCVASWDRLPYAAVKETIDYYGYNFLGTREADSQNIDDFVNGATGECNTNPESTLCDIEPYQPVYYAGYIQDKIEYKDLVLNLGLRVDVFDNNSLVLKDRFALLPIQRAASVNAPDNIGDDFAVYFDGNNNIVGYRDLDGNFFDANGQGAKGSDINIVGAPKVEGEARISSAVFEDYEPQTTWMPRIGVSFPVTDQSLFFAHYDKTSQRPFEFFHDGLEEYFLAAQGTQTVNNTGLKPTTTTEYELGFRQRVGARSAFTVSGFYKAINGLIQLESIAFGFPNGYSFYGNNDFGTVRGVQFEFDLRRTNNVSFNANYTLQYANGTGSDGLTATQIAWRGPADGSGFPNFLSPLDFDRRHSVNLNVDYRLGKGEGPSLGGATILENFGFNVVANLRSGKPFTPLQGPNPIFNSFILPPAGRLNGENLEWSTLVNLRVDRRFDLSDNLGLTAFLWVQNLLNADNTLNVYRATGLPGEDGWRESGEGRDFVRTQEIPENASFLYGVRIDDPTNYGIPRLTRLGLRVNF
ncbi:MAG TPA: TonB-dependent receptor, partial [Rhodothermales bacterium]|nr:TonB-dependent receptor [Rhodothermales bacterium]